MQPFAGFPYHRNIFRFWNTFFFFEGFILFNGWAARTLNWEISMLDGGFISSGFNEGFNSKCVISLLKIVFDIIVFFFQLILFYYLIMNREEWFANVYLRFRQWLVVFRDIAFLNRRHYLRKVCFLLDKSTKVISFLKEWLELLLSKVTFHWSKNENSTSDFYQTKLLLGATW